MTPNQRKILVAVDGSQQSLEAVRYVSGCFPPGKTEIHLLHILNRVPKCFYDLANEPQFQKSVAEIHAWESAQENSIANFMNEATAILIEAGVPRETIVLDVHEKKKGTARDILLVSGKGYDGVVVGRSGLSRFKDTIIGSVAGKLLSALTNLSLCVIGGSPQTGKILLALNESDGAMRAVDYVAKMVADVPHQVTLIHVIRGFNILERRSEFVLDQDIERKWIELDKKEMEPVFKKAMHRLTKAGMESGHISKKVITGVASRAGAIVQEAREGHYGTIVVGRRGLSGVKEFLMGRVSNKVIQSAKEEAIWVVS